MKAGKVLVLLAGAGIAAGIVLANITTPALTSYRAEHPEQREAPGDQSQGMVVDRTGQGDLSQQDYGYAQQNRGDADGDRRGYADDRAGDGSYSDDGADDQGGFGMPRWLAGPERWLAQRGWIVMPGPQAMDGDGWGGRGWGGRGQGHWQQDDGDNWQDDGDGDRPGYRQQSAPVPRGFVDAPPAALSGAQQGQSAFDRAFGSGPAQSGAPGQAPSGQAASSDSGDAAKDAASRARDAAADVLAAEGRTHSAAH
ncbi:hypothetical protein [Novosphingobium sp. 9]|uniref:hypothetical protein n=1 Tax=Novosphingobium sp. 9 TaxID=2025349 RepID=UPI0021B563EC|nr:hypothetical protein [Novosphingobium sp. 9]